MDRFDQALAAALRNQGLGGLMFLDLDQFKGLNDRYGHIMGDELLVEVARRLCLCLRGVDTVARLGGDEFVVMLQNLEGVDGLAEGVAEKIRITLAEPYLLTPRGESGGEQVVRYCCTASIGICLFDGDSPGRDELIRRADVAMYAAKSAGRNTVRTYVPELDGAA
ncbi:MAG: GGDEF domain-containing protein [Azovibrio sp.]|nr:GGDEF domain-containing protein [Azovibrio sp.]